MVLGVFSDAKRLLKTQRFNIDNWAFRLFYRPTLGILFASLALLGCNHLFGNALSFAQDPTFCQIYDIGLSKKPTFIRQIHTMQRWGTGGILLLDSGTVDDPREGEPLQPWHLRPGSPRCGSLQPRHS